MQYVGKVFSTVSQLYKELNPATLTGAIDVVVVESKDGELSCSPFHVRFGKLQLLRPSDKAVQIIVNDKPADFYMKVGDSGEGFFVLETDKDVPSQFATSPVASPSLSFKKDNVEDPDFLDLRGNVRREDHSNDGYVSAPSAHETDVEDDDNSDNGGGESDKRSFAFVDDMAIGTRHGERIFHQLNDGAGAVSGDRTELRPRSSTLFIPQTPVSDSFGNTALSRGNSVLPRTLSFNRRHQRPMSVVSDSEYILGSQTTDKAAVSSDIAAGDGPDRADSFNTGSDDGLHTDWDWGVKIAPSKKPVSIIEAESKGQKASTAPPAPETPKADHHYPQQFDASLLIENAAASKTSTVLELSLCGVDALQKMAFDKQEQRKLFDSACVQGSTFKSDPMGVITNPNLAFRVNDDVYVQGDTLLLSLVSQLAFGQSLDRCVFSQSHTDGSTDNIAVTLQPSMASGEEQQNPDHMPRYLSEASGLHDASVSTISVSGNDAASKSDNSLLLTGCEHGQGQSTPKSEGRRWWRWGQRNNPATPPIATPTKALPQISHVNATTPTFTSTSITKNKQPDVASDVVTINVPHALDDDDVVGYMSDDGMLPHPVKHQRRHYAKTLRLTSDQLKSLNLKRGANDVKFLVPSNNAYCEARIFLYKYDTQVVISDIDGTITKSDALGHLFNMVGKDWTHMGVAKLYTDIANNGYEILYLTARAIGQADGTRYFLSNVKQGEYKLPLGPLLLSPDRLFTSFHREVIMRRPHEFKMACLRDIKNLFGDYSPFYAGFGNRITDAMSYRSVNVPVSRICTIDTSGEIKLDLLPGYKSSYVKMNDLVDMMFPALSTKLDPKFNDWEYWKPTIISIDDELAELDAMLVQENDNARKNAKQAIAGGSINEGSEAAHVPALANDVARLPANALAVVTASPNPTGSMPLAALSTPELVAASRERADSWAGTTAAAKRTPPMYPLSSYTPIVNHSQKQEEQVLDRSPDSPDKQVAFPSSSSESGGSKMSILKKATSFSPFNLVRGSSPPPKFEFKHDSDVGNMFPPLSQSQPNTSINNASGIIAPKSFDFGKMVRSDPEIATASQALSPDKQEKEDAEADDPAVAAAAMRLVPQLQFNMNRNDSIVSRQSGSLASSGEDGVDSDIGYEEEDDELDQDMLAIMHDMEEVQRLQ
ncbi:Lipin/Ned1/Smp2-domain-containing protein [Coemansia spiralis]|nr:Lipin/Ned1/Smp2-domain-containing protein [Coemansia spiralis]